MELRRGVVELSDGRDLGYAEIGPPDAEARLVYCHGSPGCRLEIGALLHSGDIATSDLRIVAFDRPGYGLSSPQPGRAFIDFADDLAEATDELGIGVMSLLGASGGAPYAMAAAIALSDRVERLGIVVGIGPPAATGMEESALWRLPPRMALLRRFQFAMLALAFRRGQGDRVLDKSIATLAPVDQQAMERTEVRRWFAEVFAESLRQGGREATAETAMYRSDWGFHPRQVPVPTTLWYSGQDTNVPAAVGRWLHEEIAGSRLEVWPQHGHFTWVFSPQLADVVDELCGVTGLADRVAAVEAMESVDEADGARS